MLDFIINSTASDCRKELETTKFQEQCKIRRPCGWKLRCVFHLYIHPKEKNKNKGKQIPDLKANGVKLASLILVLQ